MNIKILDSLLREHLKTKAIPSVLAEKLSLTSLSVEKIEKVGNDYLYEMEITTNRPDLFSVIGVAREAAAVLPQFGIKTQFIPLKLSSPNEEFGKFPINIQNDPKLVNRICAVVMEVKIDKSPEKISKYLEAGGIRSLNNVVDITNYVMRIIGHPTHVFDFDRLNTKDILIREARKGEKIETLDEKNYSLLGGEIVASDKNDRIIDLLGIMGLRNSVVTDKTKKILFFIDNNDKSRIRNASMSLGIRTEAATLNEKGVDPELAYDALLYGIELFKKNAYGKQISDILDIYPNVPKQKTIKVSFEKINKIIGVKIDEKKSAKSLSDLGFNVSLKKDYIEAGVPSFRLNDIEIEEDLIEEIARIYGYHNLPSILPKTSENEITYPFVNNFYFERKVKNALRYWGFTECYTYSFVSESMFDGPTEHAVEVANPLTEDFVYMRNSLIPSLLKVVSDNPQHKNLKIFEIANVYLKNENSLPDEILTFSGIFKKDKASFYELKGIIEQLCNDLGINSLSFKKSSKSALGSSLFIEKDYLGEIEVLDTNIIDFEINFDVLLKYSTVKKEFKKGGKYPPVVEDLSLTIEKDISTEEVIQKIKLQSEKIQEVTLLDTYKNSRTFHIIYQDFDKNLTKDDVAKIREKIISSLNKSISAKIKN